MNILKNMSRKSKKCRGHLLSRTIKSLFQIQMDFLSKMVNQHLMIKIRIIYRYLIKKKMMLIKYLHQIKRKILNIKKLHLKKIKNQISRIPKKIQRLKKQCVMNIMYITQESTEGSIDGLLSSSFLQIQMKFIDRRPK